MDKSDPCLIIVVWLFVCLMVLNAISTKFQLYRGGKFYWWRKPL